MPAAEFESGSFFSFGDITVTKFPFEEGNESSNSDSYPRKNGFKFKK